MKAIKWWLTIVGAFYVMEGVGLTLLRFADPDTAASVWAPTVPVGSFDATAVQAILMAGLFANLSWIVLGVLMFWFARKPAKAGLMVAVIALEFFAWAPLDMIALASGWPVGRAATLLCIHLAIGFAGIVVLRSASSNHLAIGTASH